MWLLTETLYLTTLPGAWLLGLSSTPGALAADNKPGDPITRTGFAAIVNLSLRGRFGSPTGPGL